MMIVEDNTFDFLVRDRLKKECEERPISLSGDPTKDQLMLDMITYCSRGNKEEAVSNLTATKEFMVGFQLVQRRLPGGWWWADPNGWEFMFEFWKKCFIKSFHTFFCALLMIEQRHFQINLPNVNINLMK